MSENKLGDRDMREIYSVGFAGGLFLAIIIFQNFENPVWVSGSWALVVIGWGIYHGKKERIGEVLRSV